MTWLIDALREPAVQLGQLLLSAVALALVQKLRGGQRQLGERLDEVQAAPPPEPKPSDL